MGSLSRRRELGIIEKTHLIWNGVIRRHVRVQCSGVHIPLGTWRITTSVIVPCLTLMDLANFNLIYDWINMSNGSLYVGFQIGTQNSLELIDDPRAAAVEEITAKLGLRKVPPVPNFLIFIECARQSF